MLTKVFSYVAIGVVVLLTLSGFMGSWFVVDEGERSVVLRNGAFVRVAEPGLNFKMPIIDSAVDISVRNEKVVYERVASYSKDIQLADLRLAVNYSLDASAVRQIYQQYGSHKAAVDRILTPRVFDEAKVVFGQFNATTAISERGRLGIEIEQALRQSTEGSGILVTGVQLESIDFSKAFEQSIEARMQAEVQVATLKQNLEREKVQADIVRTKAQGHADSILAQAKADAQAIKLKGAAEAEAIEARSKALKANAALIELTKAERWNGELPTTMIPGAAIPFLQIDTARKVREVVEEDKE